ncbi:hypothetical protein [Massilia sp. CCM 8734]|uniref:hypothetical protein n=1 Tax=Massilia sp. CCM 8734 TaxID=2609283 RepID=UPI0014201577|nr:hypothetical protein [Massilia sp. CCM 8734]NHZ94587.1 hypothetical protein [Massilia sp. CCM 8734]
MKIYPLIRVLWKKSRFWLLLFVAVMNLVNIGLDMNLTREHWASWVQAVGSIAALVVAIYVMSRQNAHAARLIAQADSVALTRRANTVSVVVESAYWQIHACINHMQVAAANNDVADLQISLSSSKHVCEVIRSSLTNIPIHDLGSADMATGVIHIDSTADIILALCAGPLPTMPNVQQIAPELHTKANKAIAFFRTGMAQIGI